MGPRRAFGAITVSGPYGARRRACGSEGGHAWSLWRRSGTSGDEMGNEGTHGVGGNWEEYCRCEHIGWKRGHFSESHADGYVYLSGVRAFCLVGFNLLSRFSLGDFGVRAFSLGDFGPHFRLLGRCCADF